MNKLEGYSKLYEIRDKYNEDVTDYVKKLAMSNDVPNEVLMFINKHVPQDSLITYNTIYEKRYKNPLYKNLVNENSSLQDKAIALSSLLTQSMIRLKNISDESKKSDYIDEMNIDNILESLKEYCNGDSNKLNETWNNIRIKLKLLN